MSHPRVGIVLMAKPPEPGESKTRLASDVGDRVALGIYTALLGNALVAIEESSPGHRFVYSYGADFTAALPDKGFEVIADLGGGRLPEKVEHAFTECFRRVDQVLMVIADDAFMDAFTLRKALDAVVAGKVVVGPTWDGGLYLIGLSRHQAKIADSLPFGRPTLCDALISRAVKHAYPVHVLDRHIDVDTEEHLKKALELGSVVVVPADVEP